MQYQQTCKESTCDLTVTFDAGDPRHTNSGALLVGAEPPTTRIAYLRCENGHRHRYEFGGTDG